MNLARTIELLKGGGPGSGCRGPTCGRKAGPGQPPPPGRQPGQLKPQPQPRRPGQVPQPLTRQQRAKLSYKPASKDKHDIADASEAELSKALGMDRTPDNSPFDLIKPGIGVEVKTLIDNKNDKITMHPPSRRRKEEAARQENRKMYTVVIDKRGQTPVYYFAKGVGAFRIGSMQTVKSPKELKGLLVA